MVDTGQEAGQHSGPGAHLQDGHQPLGRQAPTVLQTPEQEGVENPTGRSGLQGSSPGLFCASNTYIIDCIGPMA